MIQRLRDLLAEDRSFAFESTAAGTNYVKHIKEAKAKGYEINLVYLWLESPEHAMERVEERVQQGGHNIPKEAIVRRYFSGLKNLVYQYLPLVDIALVMDNSTKGEDVRLVAHKTRSSQVEVVDAPTWKKMEAQARGK